MWVRVASLALPCYVANAAPVVVAKLMPRRHPIDFGLKFLDGRRIFGDSKSIEGFAAGVAAGSAASLPLHALGLLSVGEGVALACGAMLGDLLGSFVKRRLGLGPGAPAPLLDQLLFLITALALYQALFGLLEVPTAIVLCLITPPLHLATNFVAYRLGLKDRPW